MSLIRWLDSKPFAQQLVILSAVLDPLGIGGGYLLAPDFGLDPVMGAAVGAVVASIPTSLWVLRYQQKHGG